MSYASGLWVPRWFLVFLWFSGFLIGGVGMYYEIRKKENKKDEK